MASHQHCHHHHHQTHHQIDHCHSSSSCSPPPPPCTCCNSTCCISSSPSPPPRPNPTDQLLQILTTHLLLQSQSSPPPAPLFYSYEFLNSSPPPNPPFTPHPFPYLSHKTHQSSHLFPKQSSIPIPHPHKGGKDPLASLLDRVTALESSLPAHLFPNPPQRIPKPPAFTTDSDRQYSRNGCTPRTDSLRDLAARTIQARFRQFLVRRSQTLRDLRLLAAIKSHVAALRSSVSHRANLHPRAISDRAADLLLQLESIKSGDVMIHEGKRSIERELVRIVEFVDKILLKDQEIALKATRIEENDENGETKPRKKVSFCSNQKELFKEEADEVANGDCFELPNGVLEINSEKKKMMSGLSAPLPEQMEPRRSAGN